MSVLSASHFHNEVAAIARLEEIVWPQGPHCPRCGSFDRITDVRGGRAGLRRCGPCKREFTVTVGTIFERSHVKLHIWFQAAHLMASSKKGISAHQLHRTLKVTYKTAWFMEHRLREAMREGHFTVMGGEGKIVEADETCIGGKEKNKHRSKRNAGNIGGMGKEIAFSLVERRGKVRSQHVASVTSKTLRETLVCQRDADTTLMTDDAGQYRQTHKDFTHEVVNHGIGEYVRGDAHTNTIEGYFSILKRGITGTYHHVSPQHLKRYLAEFDFRYNERMALGVSDEARTTKALRGIIGKRLKYRDS
ncbi:IS1595 family transposase [Bradyrhizobium sp. B120]|uniref:IS1595 family transposase n=1 Tax=Bradyrhizobium sp. B120 TaxID=3410088 RepID=UPI003B986813